MTDFDPVRRLKEMARDIAAIPFNLIKPMTKVFFICINTYKGYNHTSDMEP
jgi:hypothetical protein